MAFQDIPGWSDDDHCAALACYSRSVHRAEIALPGVSENANGDQAIARRFFEENFIPLRVIAEPGLLTSYFQPRLKGSRAPSSLFSIPVYRRPQDLSLLPTDHSLAAEGLTAARAVGGTLEPYHTRAEIEAGALAGRGLEILYLSDAVEAFIMHVQGSGEVELEDGSTVKLSFDGKNGHPYTSIARHLVERGILTQQTADLDGMIECLRARADRSALLQENKSYIFFKELDPEEPGPVGSLGVELYPGRSLAVDPLYHEPGLPIWVFAPDLIFDGQPFERLTVAQDTGSAIKGQQRGDIFAGTGFKARSVAGRVRHRCEFFVLRPKC